MDIGVLNSHEAVTAEGRRAERQPCTCHWLLDPLRPCPESGSYRKPTALAVRTVCEGATAPSVDDSLRLPPPEMLCKDSIGRWPSSPVQSLHARAESFDGWSALLLKKNLHRLKVKGDRIGSEEIVADHAGEVKAKHVFPREGAVVETRDVVFL